MTSFFAMAAYSGSHSWSTIRDRRTHPQLEAMVREKVGSGQYNDAGEVVREALQLMDERDRHERLRTAIAVGLKQIERGEIIPWTADFMDRVIREADEEDRQQLKAALDDGLAEIARGEDQPWTAESWAQLVAEADEEDRLGLPISHEARLLALNCTTGTC